MKKNLLLCLIIFNGLFASAQVRQLYPAGFRKANMPEGTKTSISRNVNDNSRVTRQVPFITSELPRINALPIVAGENLVGNTFYDLQTNNSISNRLCVNDDGTISAGWIYSPNAISTTIPPFPDRTSGYIFWDGNVFNQTGPVTNLQTGFTNIVVTPISELLVEHSNVGTTDSSQIVISHRAIRGTGAWTQSFPWGHAHHLYPKACAAGSSGLNNNAYVIFIDNSQTNFGRLNFSRSQDGGITWQPNQVLQLIDTNFYIGFRGDDYSIDAKDSIVAIGFGNLYTDVGILKSTDYGQTWTKTIILSNPFVGWTDPITDFNHDGIIDTVFTNNGDVKVLIDNSGMVHAWFSAARFYIDSVNGYNTLPITDGLEYWNESMSIDNYVEIAASQDFNGNGILDIPTDTFTNCTNLMPWGEYNGGMTIMPSAGIDANGIIYMAYHALTESAETTFYHALRRHVYVMTLAPPYDPATWTYPYNIIPSIAQGGSGETQEGAYACLGRRVDNNYAYVLYQRDDAPGHALAADGTCDKLKNFGNSSDIVLTVLDKTTVGISIYNRDDLFVSQNYPNPVAGMTYINVNLKKSSDLRFEVYDVVGKKVHSEMKKHLQAGNHTLAFNASVLEMGIYNYTVSAGGQRTSRRMIVQR